MEKARILGVGAHVPSRRVHNDELAAMVQTSDEWIHSHTGIRYRHIADEEESASDLALPAARQAIAQAGIDVQAIDLILLATSTPDYLGLPSTACVVQDRLGIVEAAAMDLTAACSGFVYGLETARAYVESGAAGTVLLIGSEIYSKIINWKDRRTCVLFGDGAGAVVVGRHGERGVFPAYLGSQGSGAESLFRSHGGSRNRYVPGQTPEEDLKLKMDGHKVYRFAVEIVVNVINTVLERAGKRFDDLAWVVPHQANVRIIKAAAKRAGWDLERFYINIEEYANTSAASIPIALREMLDSDKLTTGDLVLVTGFGGGLTYGGALIQI